MVWQIGVNLNPLVGYIDLLRDDGLYCKPDFFFSFQQVAEEEKTLRPEQADPPECTPYQA